MSKISIITTTYNHKDFIKDTIESIINQSFSDRELLIWDDSPDNKTWDIIQSYVKKYPNKIKAWHHQPNKWIVDNMNFLLSKINYASEYVAFLEWDDMYAKNNLEEKIKIFRKYKDVFLVYSDFSIIDKQRKTIKEKCYDIHFPVPNNVVCDSYLFATSPINIFSYTNCMIRKDILSSIKIRNLTWNKSFSTSDWDFYFQILTKYKNYYINEPLFFYRIHWNNITLKNNNILLDLWEIYYYYISFWIFKKNKILYIIINPFKSTIKQKLKLFVALFIPIKYIKKLLA